MRFKNFTLPQVSYVLLNKLRLHVYFMHFNTAFFPSLLVEVPM